MLLALSACAVALAESRRCERWASIGECGRNPVFMRSHCTQECAAVEEQVAPSEDAAALSNGVLLPMVGFGTAASTRTDAMERALRAGYKLFDTGQAEEWYREDELGEALARARLRREGIFLTTKLHPRDLGEQATRRAISRSLRRLRVGQIDAFLLQYPSCDGGLCAAPPEGNWSESWRALEALHAEGTLRAIGVSSFSVGALRRLLGMARTKPHIVQGWMDPFHQARELRRVCAEHGIQFQATSSLGGQHRTPHNPVLHSQTIRRVAAAHGVSPAQVALRWATQHGAAVIPRSRHPDRVKANLALFQFRLTQAQMAEIDELDDTVPLALPPPPPPLHEQTCKDNYDHCDDWARQGECGDNPRFMHPECSLSCERCGDQLTISSYPYYFHDG